MKEFLQLMRRFVSPYKKYIGWAILLNILSAVFNVFSFTLLIPRKSCAKRDESSSENQNKGYCVSDDGDLR